MPRLHSRAGFPNENRGVKPLLASPFGAVHVGSFDDHPRNWRLTPLRVFSLDRAFPRSFATTRNSRLAFPETAGAQL